MQRMTQLPSKLKSIDIGRFIMAAVAIASAVTVGLPEARAQMGGVIQADYAAGGFLPPAGIVPPEQMMPPQFYAQGYPHGIMPVGWLQGSACDAGSCDGGCDGGCDSACSSGGGGCGLSGQECAGGGIFGPADSDCGDADGGILSGKGCGQFIGSRKFRSGSRRPNCRTGATGWCIFCRGSGCSACQMHRNGVSPFACLGVLLPHKESGICAMRWYDMSVEAVWLDHSTGGGDIDVTSLGIGGTRVLNTRDATVDLEAGVRVSAAMIFGPGSNLEFTYLGGHDWSGGAQATDPNAQLFSFLTDFGTAPSSALDDVDNSLVQRIDITSKLHSGELNYRRRTVWPCCRFQGSWLVGLRYLRYDDGLIYATRGQDNNTGQANQPRFFSSNDLVKNNLFGGQIGCDFWWNVSPGINVGWGAKGAWVQNDLDRRLVLNGNSINTTGFSDSDQDGTVMGDFEAKLVYRMTHSWTLRSAYYAIVIDDIAFGSVDQTTITDLVDNNPVNTQVQYDSLVLQGFSVGAEFMW